MQPLLAGPRIGITGGEDRVRAMLTDGPIRHGFGLELTDLSMQAVANISHMCKGGSVKRSSYATLHGTGRLTVAGELDWGSAIVRPWYTLSDGTVTARWNLGAYFTSTPKESTLTTPDMHEVECYDVLSILDDPVADTHVVPTGTSVLDAVETILINRHVQRYRIDATHWSKTVTSDRVWKFDPQLTWLLVVNDLLASIGYAGIYSDWDGHLVCQQYLSPRERGPEWTFTSDKATTMLGRQRERVRDYYRAYNSWVFYKGTGIATDTPVEGNGRYSFTNENLGPTSVAARGRVITRPPEALDVVDHESLVAAAQRIIDNDMIVPTRFSLTTAPHPGAWHFDRYRVEDSHFGAPNEVIGTEWELPLNGHAQRHEWTVL